MTCIQKSRLVWLVGGFAGGIAGGLKKPKHRLLGTILGAALGALLVGGVGDKMLENNSPSCN